MITINLPKVFFSLIEAPRNNRYLLDKVNFDFYKLDDSIQITRKASSYLVCTRAKNVIEELEKLKKNTLISLKRKLVKDNDILRLALNISQVCRLKCRYCYANAGTYGNPGFMKRNVLVRTLDFFLSNYNVHNIHIFGGEPLLNIEMIEEMFRILTSKYAKKFNNLRITVATSLFVSEETINRFIKIYESYKDKFQIYMVVSLDGPKEIQDNTRPSLDSKSSSFDRIKTNINLLKQKGFSISFEVTYTKLHKQLGWDILKIYKYFYTEFNAANVIISPVYDWNGFLDKNLRIDISIAQEYYEIIASLLEKSRKGDLNDFDRALLRKLLMNYLNPGDSSDKTIVSTFCPAGSNSFIVDIFGNIYPCQLVVGNPKYRISNVVEDNEEKTLRNLKNCRNKDLMLFTKTKYSNCKDCCFLFYCSKCVFKRDYQKDMFKTCDVEKKIIETILEFDPWALLPLVDDFGGG